MANQPLRAYIRDIEGIIDNGQLEETVAHCRHALQFFPKYIDIYRLLGKVFLEGRQFTNAGDIFQRVLSAVPDDFVSHVGMSIIREDEGNLDAAIWHMERAFENQPANNAIQGELRRLFGRRDGMEPPKIRLTRGALARMYVKGNLYDQAVAELRGALSDDPQRPDLQILLAEMNYLSGNRVDAVEMSSNIINKFPYCLIANRILAIILPQTDRADDAKIYSQRALSLDPYLSKAGSEALTSDDVPDNAVMIETLEWETGQTIPGLPEQPAWADSLGIKFEETEEEQLPDWLAEDLEIPTYEGRQVAPFIEGDEPDIQPVDTDESETQIPDWMQEAGWQPSSGDIDEMHQIDDDREFQADEAEIESADIPDWLQEIAPMDSLDESITLDEGTEDEIPTWLDESPPGPTDTITSWLDEKDEARDIISEKDEAVESLDEVSEWSEDNGEDLSETISEEGATGDIEIPEWLRDLEIAGELDLSVDEATGEDEIPEWLDELEASSEEDPTGESFEEIDSVADAIPEDSVTFEEQPQDAAEELDDEYSLEDQDSALAWLETLAAKQGASEDELITSPEERRETPPAWIEEDSDPGEEISIKSPTDEEMPDWIKESGSVDEQEDTNEIVDEEDKLPDWLSDIEVETPEDTKLGTLLDREENEEIDQVREDEIISSEFEGENLVDEIPSEGETPIESTPDLESISEPAEWIHEIQESELPSLEGEEDSQPVLEENEKFDDSQISKIDEEILSEKEVQVDINKASLSELENIPGIGFVLAQNIIEYREKHGKFETVDDIKSVTGIGEVSFETYKDQLIIEEPQASADIVGIDQKVGEIDKREVLEIQKILKAGEIERAIEAYESLIRSGQHLEEIISDLEEALSQNPDIIHLWQTLGDAYMRNDQFQQALDAYTKAEKLL